LTKQKKGQQSKLDENEPCNYDNQVSFGSSKRAIDSDLSKIVEEEITKEYRASLKTTDSKCLT
jgi:hypothetical protein